MNQQQYLTNALLLISVLEVFVIILLLLVIKFREKQLQKQRAANRKLEFDLNQEKAKNEISKMSTSEKVDELNRVVNGIKFN